MNTVRLSYFEQQEDYKVMLMTGAPTEVGLERVDGSISTGEFGSMLREVFEPASEVLRGVVKARITNALSRWLGHRLNIEQIEVVWDDAAAMMDVSVAYRAAGSADTRVLRFQRSSS